MPSIDERVVAISFENSTFEQRVSTTLTTLTKLDTALKNAGQTSGFSQIEAQANKVTLQGPMSALDKLKARLGLAGAGAAEGLGQIDQAGNKVTLQGPMSALDKLKARLGMAGSGASEGLGQIDQAGNKVTLQGPMSALDKLRSKLSGAGSGATEGFSEIEQASNKVQLEGVGRAVDKTQAKMAQLSAGDTFTDIEKASSRVSLSGLSSAIDTVQSKFSVLAGAASVALGGIAQQAIAKGSAFAKSFTFAPIMDGLNEYQTNLQAIQTVQANTDQPLTKINKSLTELNKYSDQTIYNFGEMAKNVGTFTAAGVDLKTSVSSIKGIANMAALSGSNSQQAATAMYQLSQAISSGKVGLQDWNSVVNAGMGGKKLQNALAQTGVAMGKLSDGAVKMSGPMKKLTIDGQSFRESIMTQGGAPSWLSSDILVNTLATLDGRFSRAALSAEKTSDGLQKYSKAEVEAKIQANRHALELKNGVKYTDAQFKSLMKLSDSAFKSATEVKTLGQVFDIAKETIGSGWSASFQSIFGNLGEAKKLFTGMSNAINGFINDNAMARNQVLHDWKKLGGRTDLIDGLKAAFQALSAIIKPIGQAFRDIFPRKTGADLAEMTKNFKDFMVTLKPSPELVDNIRRIFAGLFAVVHIGWTAIKALGSVLGELLGTVGKGSGGFLSFIAGIGDFLVAVDKAITQGDIFKSVFKSIGSILAVPLRLIVSLGKALAGLFSGGGSNAIRNAKGEVVGMTTALTPAQKLITNLESAWHKLTTAFQNTKKALEPYLTEFVNKLKDLGGIIANAIKGISFDNVIKGIQTGLLAGIFVTLKKAFGAGGGVMESLSGTLDSFSGVLKGFTGQMEVMQEKIKAQAILLIAGAVVVLASGIFILSTIDGDKLAKAMSAVAIGLGELMGAMKIMTGGMGKFGALQLPVIAAGLIGLSIAVVILAGAMKIFASIDLADIGKGMVAIAGSLTAVALGMRLMPATLPLTAAGLVLISVALNLIAGAMKVFGSMKLTEIAKGIFAMVEALGGIALGVSMMPPTMPLTAAGLILMGIGLSAVAGAIKAMGSMDFKTLIIGLGAMMAALAGIGLAVSLIPPTLPITAAGLVIVGTAMNIMAAAIGVLGKMKVATLVKGLLAMGGALVVLAGGLTLMAGTLPGAAALMAASVALAILAPTLALLGTLSWGTIIKGLVAIGLAMGTLALVGALAAAPLAQLGIALLPLAGVLVLTAGAVFIFAKGLSLLGENGAKGIGVFLTALTAFIAVLPTIVISFVKGLLEIVNQITVLAPKIIDALDKILTQVIAFIAREAPKLGIAIGILVDTIIQVLVTNLPKIQAAGFKLFMSLLQGISSNTPQIVAKVADIITKFLNALAAKAPQLISAGTNVLVSFLKGITQKIPLVVSTVSNMVVKFINALSSNISKIINAGQNMMVKFLGAIAGFVPKLVSKGVEIILSFIRGISQNINKVISKGADLIIKFIEGITANMNKIANKGADAVIKFLNGLADTIRTKGPQLRKAGWNVASALIDGIWAGIAELGQKVVDKLGWLIHLLPSAARKILGIKSPSTVFHEIGRFSMMGLVNGIDDPSVHTSLQTTGTKMAQTVPNIFRSVLGIASPSSVMRELGKNVTQGFAQGLHEGTVSDIDKAFSDMNSRLSDQIAKSKETIKNEQANLRDLLSADKPDYSAIEKSRQAISEETKILNASKAARQTLIKGLALEHAQLRTLAVEFDTVSKSLEKATQTLEEAKRQRDDAEKAYTEQYSSTPEITEETTTADYRKALQERLDATKSYAETLQKLRNAGLDDTTYKKLLEQGISGKKFAEALLAGGATAIAGVNALDKQLQTVAAKMARQASRNLYQAGVDAAESLVKGLKARKGELKNSMDDLADAIVRQIKARLKMHSPSQVFIDMGQRVSQGFAEGIGGNASLVKKNARGMADQALTATAEAFSDLPSMGVDVNPTITPVLDLSQVNKDARALNSTLSGTTPMRHMIGLYSGRQADSIAAAPVTQGVLAPRTIPTTTVTYEQNNYSPDPISHIELYRQTNNQLAKLRSMVGLVGVS